MAKKPTWESHLFMETQPTKNLWEIPTKQKILES